MDQLTSDILAEILSYCHKEDAVELSRVNRALNNSLDEHSSVWRVLCNRDRFNTELLFPIISYRDLYMQYEENIGINQSTWFCRYDALKMEWEVNEHCLSNMASIINKSISIVTIVDLDDRTSCHVLNTLLGMRNAYQMGNNDNIDVPSLCVWEKPLIFSGGKDVLFLRACGLHGGEQDEHVRYLRKSLMDLVMLLSSTVIICKTAKDGNQYLDILDSLVNFVQEPSLFSTYRDIPSCLIIEDEYYEDEQYNGIVPRAYDMLADVAAREPEPVSDKERSQWRHGAFASCLVNWFGKVHGIKVNSVQCIDDAYRSDLWAFLSSVLHEMRFGWPLSRWDRLQQTGPLCRSFCEHLVKEENKYRSGAFVLTTTGGIRSSITNYERAIHKFAQSELTREMRSSIEFYQRATQSELSTAEPLEMQVFVQLSEMHAQSALRTFTQSVKSALFNHHVVDEIETQLKSGINNNFRPLWRENARNSENYCQHIFDSCFKWIRAQSDCPGALDDQFKSGFEQQFTESLSVYLNNARGTRTHFVMNFCAKQYLEMVAEMYPDMRESCDRLLVQVEDTTMRQTLHIDKQRNYLQRLTGLRLKLLTIENAIERLEEEIQARNQQMQLCEEWNDVRRDRLYSITASDNDGSMGRRYDQLRYVFIQLAQQQLQHEREQYNHYQSELKSLLEDKTAENTGEDKAQYYERMYAKFIARKTRKAFT